MAYDRPMKGGGKWEEMNVDCLVNIFGRVGIESLLLDLPYVCKRWYKATLNPLCWQHILFPSTFLGGRSSGGCKSRLEEEYDFNDKSSVTSLIKLVVKRGDGLVTDLALPGTCTKEALLYVADVCPNLRVLVLPTNLLANHWRMVLKLVGKWKNLEFLRLGDVYIPEITYIEEILGRIVKHCKNFTGLSFTEAYIAYDESSAVVNLLPKIKHLDIRGSEIGKYYLVKILKGCSELEHLDARNCTGFDENDEEIIKLGSHIRKFMREGSRLREYRLDYSPNSNDGDFDYDSEYARCFN